jgi:hypothetical protein
MTRVFEALRNFFGRDEELGPVTDHLLHGGLNPAARNELFYAELIKDKWDERFREYPWPPGWNG